MFHLISLVKSMTTLVVVSVLQIIRGWVIHWIVIIVLRHDGGNRGTIIDWYLAALIALQQSVNALIILSLEGLLLHECLLQNLRAAPHNQKPIARIL